MLRVTTNSPVILVRNDLEKNGLRHSKGIQFCKFYLKKIALPI